MLLPVVLGAITTWVVAKIKEVRLKVQSDRLAYAMRRHSSIGFSRGAERVDGCAQNVEQEEKPVLLLWAKKALADEGYLP